MISRTTGYDVYSLQIPDDLIVQTHRRKVDAAILDIGVHGITDCLRLLKDLLQHEMLITAFFCGFLIPFNLHQLFLDLIPVDIVEMDFLPGQLRDLQIIDIVNSPHTVQDRRYIRRDKMSRLIFSDDQRAVLTGRKNFARIIREQDTKCIGTPDTQHGTAQSLQRCARLLIIIIDQLRSDLRICLRIKCIAGLQQLLPDLLVILNDTVVHQHNGLILRTMRMRVHLRRLPMGRPAGMADSAGASHCVTVIGLLRQRVQPTLCLDDLDISGTLIPYRDTGRIISPVFQLCQTVQQHRRSRTVTAEAYDSTHKILLSRPSRI